MIGPLGSCALSVPKMWETSLKKPGRLCLSRHWGAGGGCPFLIYSPSQHHHPVSPVLGGWEEDCWVILGPLSLGQDLHGLDCL